MRPMMMTVVLLTCAGCGNTRATGSGVADMATAVLPDLWPGGAVADFGFGGYADGGAGCSPSGGSAQARYVWNAEMLPMQRSDFAFDLNGDGRTDNQYGNIVAALSGIGIDVQGAAAQTMLSGQSITLVVEASSDAAFANDACAVTTTYAGKAMASPDFSGNGHFTIDPAAIVGHFNGPIAASRFTSEPAPATAQNPSVMRVSLALWGTTPVDLVGARITYRRAADGTITGGQVNGAVRQNDIDHQLVPALARSFTAKVQTDPTSTSSMQLLGILDNGGADSAGCGMTCENLDGSCAVAHDNVISDCEVATNTLMKNVLAPDVQMFDASGSYHPSAKNSAKDSMSIGLGFTAVGATF